MSQSPDKVHTYVSPEGWYALKYPDSWEVELEEDCTFLSRKENGVGALQLSAYQTPTPETSKGNLANYLADEGKVNNVIYKSRLKTGEEIASTSFERENVFTKIWFVTKGNYVVFATYISDAQLKNNEISDVDSILNSLSLTE